MRKTIIASLLALFVTLTSEARAQWVAPPNPAVHMFYSELAPYGQWVFLPLYGWCWQPNPLLGAFGWAPYTRGHWELTEAGWTWVSDFAWGWATFHYGGWVDDGFYGWVWVPDVYWAPAWVEWRIGGGYVGWRPLPPRHVTIARPVTTAHPPRGWTFVATAQFVAPVRPLPAAQVEQVWARTQAIAEKRAVGGVHVFAGPTVAQVELRVGRPIRQRTLVDVHRSSPIWSPRITPPSIRPAPARPAPPPRIRPSPARPVRPRVS